mgnify:CR=1 FL=1
MGAEAGHPLCGGVGRNTYATLFAYAQQRLDQRSPGGHRTLNPVCQQVSLGGGNLDAGYHVDAVAWGQIARPQRALRRPRPADDHHIPLPRRRSRLRDRALTGSLDARTGKEVWKADTFEDRATRFYTITGPPIVPVPPTSPPPWLARIHLCVELTTRSTPASRVATLPGPTSPCSRQVTAASRCGSSVTPPGRCPGSA